MSSGTHLFVDQLLAGLQLVEHELLLFAAFWFLVSAVDEVAIDLSWLWLRLTGRAHDSRLPKELEGSPLSGRAAVLVPAWHEADVIGAMIGHMLKAWPQEELTLYVGGYCNDPETVDAAMKASAPDHRVRIVIHGREGPTTKADCLNQLYTALEADELRGNFRFKSVILHDAEDMVHPAALSAIDRALSEVDFVQLPVRPEPQPDSRWVAGHYSDEFAEAHAKSLVVRDALGAALPAAGVGCGFSRDMLTALARQRVREGSDGPFAADCLTEDYELGLLVSRSGARSRFLRLRDHLGELVATRAFFPGKLDDSVRQKARWIHGIALQGWDRLGWVGGPVNFWMELRDRRGPLIAIVLAVAYSLLLIEGILGSARLAGWQDAIVLSPLLKAMLSLTFVALIWRLLWRFAFTAGEYGLVEGLLAIPRVMVANVISIMAGRRALFAYVRTLNGSEISWDKTQHTHHPAKPGKRALV